MIWLIGLPVFMVVLLLVASDLYIWYAHDFSADAFKIDACLDQGGAWMEEKRACSHRFD